MTTTTAQWTARGIPIAPDQCGVTDYWCGVIDTADPTAWRRSHWVMARCTVHSDGKITHRVIGPIIDVAGRVVEWFPRVGLLDRIQLTDREYVAQIARVDLKGVRLPGGGKPALIEQWDAARPSTAEYRQERLREFRERFGC